MCIHDVAVLSNLTNHLKGNMLWIWVVLLLTQTFAYDKVPSLCHARIDKQGYLTITVDRGAEKHDCLTQTSEKDIIGCFFHTSRKIHCRFTNWYSETTSFKL